LLSQLADRRLDRGGLYEHFREALQQCMERLNASDRELLDVCYDGTDSVKDVAAKLGRSADSVYHSLRRIRGVLFECINRTAAQEEQTR
jgi:RNA polymerase sigma-70 factor (ECF subfamily)